MSHGRECHNRSIHVIYIRTAISIYLLLKNSDRRRHRATASDFISKTARPLNGLFKYTYMSCRITGTRMRRERVFTELVLVKSRFENKPHGGEVCIGSCSAIGPVSWRMPSYAREKSSKRSFRSHAAPYFSLFKKKMFDIAEYDFSKGKKYQMEHVCFPRNIIYLLTFFLNIIIENSTNYYNIYFLINYFISI